MNNEPFTHEEAAQLRAIAQGRAVVMNVHIHNRGITIPKGLASFLSDNFISGSQLRVEGTTYVTAMNFGEAVEMLKAKKRVARSGWNGKGMYLGLCEGGGWRDGFRTADFIYMKTADDKIVPWQASQTDVLAEDWGIVE